MLAPGQRCKIYWAPSTQVSSQNRRPVPQIHERMHYLLKSELTCIGAGDTVTETPNLSNPTRISVIFLTK